MAKSKVKITDEIINNVKVVNLDIFDNEELVIINKINKDILKRSRKKNFNNEVGVLIDMKDWSQIVIYGDLNYISISKNKKAYNKILKSSKHSLIFIHNHPNNHTFSEADINSFCMNDSLLMASIICNSGKQYYLIKSNNFDKYKTINYYNKIVINKKEKNGIKEFLRTCSKVGLTYKFGG